MAAGSGAMASCAVWLSQSVYIQPVVSILLSVCSQGGLGACYGKMVGVLAHRFLLLQAEHMLSMYPMP